MANEYLQRTPTSTGNRKIFTFSAWVKQNNPEGTNQYLFGAFSNGNNAGYQNTIALSDSEDRAAYYQNTNSVANSYYKSVNLYRDAGNWLHILIAVDSSEGQGVDRAKIYINGARNKNTSIPTLTSEGHDASFNSTVQHMIGNWPGLSTDALSQLLDVFWVDGQALTPDVFGFYKEGKGYQSSGASYATDFRPGQWVPKAPRTIKTEINRRGGFGVNGFYLPMNDSSNFGADFHCAPNSIIKLKGEDLPQPRNGAPTTTDAYVSQLREDPYKDYLVYAVPGISTSTSANLVTNGTFETVVDGETGYDNGDGTVDGWNKNSIGSLSITSGTTGRALRVSQPSATAGVTYGQGSISLGTLTSGKRYLLKYSGLGGTAKKYPAICTNANTSNTDGSFLGLVAQIGAYSTAAEEVQKYFEPSSTAEHWLVLMLGDDGAGTYHDFDNIVVIQEDAPRDYSADIKGSGTNKTITASGSAGIGYEFGNYYGSAIDFDGSGFNDYIETPHSTDFNFGSGDFTVECWRYLDSFNDGGAYLAKYDGTIAGSDWYLSGQTNGVESFYWYNGPANTLHSVQSSSNTTSLNQWDHIAACRKGNQISLFVNGACVGTATTTISLNDNTEVVRSGADASGLYQMNGRLQDIRVYKGVAKYEGGFDVPKPYTPVGIATWRQVSDTTANNFATLNPLIGAGTAAGDTVPALLSGNLYLDNANQTWAPANVGVSTGKWYAEFMCLNGSFGSNIGVSGDALHGKNNQNSFNAAGVSYVRLAGSSYTKQYNSTSTVAGSLGYSSGDIVSVTIDVPNREFKFYKNNTLIFTDTSASSYSPLDTNYYFTPFRTNDGANPVGSDWSDVAANFGQNPTFSGNTTAGTYTDSNGKGLFKYQPPSGFLALCEDNLPTPAIADPGKHFQTLLWDGQGSPGKKVTGLKFKPDLVWIKNRANGVANSWHSLSNSVTNSRLFPNETDAGDSFKDVASFDDDGFSLGYGTYVNYAGGTYVGWCWKAGGNSNTFNVDGTGYATASAAGITDGSIPLTGASVNTTAGFSIVAYEGTGGSGTATFSHGLNKTPSFVIIKNRDATSNWGISHPGLTNNNYYVLLPSNGGEGDYGSLFIDRGSSLITIDRGSSILNTSANSHIAYCWTEIENFSKIGTFTGNGDPDGPFIWCGFKPAFVWFKTLEQAGDWIILDSSRDPTNPCNNRIDANAATGDTSETLIDFLSNGFKLRTSSASKNPSGERVLFMAFAESPFQTANAK